MAPSWNCLLTHKLILLYWVQICSPQEAFRDVLSIKKRNISLYKYMWYKRFLKMLINLPHCHWQASSPPLSSPRLMETWCAMPAPIPLEETARATAVGHLFVTTATMIWSVLSASHEPIMQIIHNSGIVFSNAVYFFPLTAQWHIIPPPCWVRNFSH